MGSGCPDPRFLKSSPIFGSKLISGKLLDQAESPGEECPSFQLDSRLNGPQSRFEGYGEMTIFNFAGTRIPTTRPSSL
jgi:hypothetical protein